MNNINWVCLFEYAIKTVFIGGIVLIIGAFIKKWVDRTLHEHQIRFSKLHNDRVIVIRELYSKLIKMEKSLHSYMHPTQYENSPAEDTQQKMAYQDTWKFIMYFDENRIFFNEFICNLIEEIYQECRKAWIDFHLYRDANQLTRAIQSKKSKLESGAYNSIKGKLPKLRKKLEDEFRKLLGVGLKQH